MLQRLRERYPVVNTQLAYQTPFQLLIATILSAQCTDRQVNRVTQTLFAAYPDPETLAAAPLEEIKQLIFSTRFYNSKAENIKACAKKLLDRFGGEVPRELEALVTLPGVGRKTANVVRSVCFNAQAIVVDTHVYRLSRRLGLSQATDPVRMEFDLMAIVPEASWNDLSLQLIYLGREICGAKKPLCQECFLHDLCLARDSAGR